MKPFEQISYARQIERWKQCERVLVEMPEHERLEHFKMSTFGEPTPCGTVACAAGHCGLDPWFRNRGFRLKLIVCNGKCGNTECTYVDAHIPDVGMYFGDGGRKIFLNTNLRPVETVIEEVRQHIIGLQYRQLTVGRAA